MCVGQFFSLPFYPTTTPRPPKKNRTRMHVVFFVLLIIVCVLGIAILTLVLFNSIRRVYESKPLREDQSVGKRKVVDLFVAQFSELPDATLQSTANKHADFKPSMICGGMTALIDRGMYHLETGIYMLQNNNVWVPIGMPEVGDQFLIRRGEHAKKQHTIRASFVHEIRPPSETQIWSASNTVQVLQESTAKVLVQDDIAGVAQVSVNQAGCVHHAHNSGPNGRTLTIINASPSHSCILVMRPFGDNFTVPPKTIRVIQLQLKSNVDGCFFYDLIARDAS